MHVRAASVPARSHRDEEMAEPQRARGRSTYYYYDHTGAKTKAVEQASMQAAISLFCSTLRELVLRFDGYECKEPEPGKFTLAFSQLEDALLFASKLHTELLSVPWPPDVLNEPHCAEEYNAVGRVVFRGLRARVGIAYGTPTMRKPLNSGRADYFGPLPNLAARVMASAAYGQTLVEPTLQLRGVAWDSTAPVLRSWDESDPDDVLLTVLGRFSLKGVPHEVTLAQVGAHARASHACTHACTHARRHTQTVMRTHEGAIHSVLCVRAFSDTRHSRATLAPRSRHARARRRCHCRCKRGRFLLLLGSHRQSAWCCRCRCAPGRKVPRPHRQMTHPRARAHLQTRSVSQ
jgi:hypothetical protein